MASLFLGIFILPLTAILLLSWFISKNDLFLKLLKLVWGGLIALIILASILVPFHRKKKVKKSDIYGQYIIDRTKFPGKQADWQYEHFRFEITKRNKLIFHHTDGKEILKTDTAHVKFLEYHANNRIRIIKYAPMHHIVDSEPTLYRNIWSFYYVFESPEFGNVFFTKGKWKALK